MAKISALADATPISGSERFPLVQDDETRAATFAQFMQYQIPLLPEWLKGNPGGTDYAPGTLAQLTGMTIAAGIDQVIATGRAHIGDDGAGMVLVADPAVDAAFVAANPQTSFIDMAGRGFRRASEYAGGNGAAKIGAPGGTVLDHLGRVGFNVEDLGVVPGQNITAALQTLCDEASLAGVRYPTIRLGRGIWFVTGAGIDLTSYHVNLMGEGLNASRIHADVDADQFAMRLKNYGARTEYFEIDAGTPEDIIYDPATDSVDVTAARAIVRHGIEFDWFAGHGTIRSIEMRWFNGTALRFVNAFDTVIEQIITRDSGNETSYAIDFCGVGDTCNHMTVTRIQPEDSWGKAIRFDHLCLNMTVENLHCEGTRGTPGQYALVLQGSGMSFRNARIANDAGNVEVLLGGAGNVYDRYTFETGTVVDYSWGVSSAAARSTIQNCSFDTLRIPPSNIGQLLVTGSKIDQLGIEYQPSVVLSDCIVGFTAIGGDASDVRFEGGQVTGGWANTGGSTTVRCNRTKLTKMPTAAFVYLTDCDIEEDCQTGFNQQVYAHNCRFKGDIILANNGARVWLSGHYTVAGSLRYAAGDAFGTCGPEGSVAGTIHPGWYGTGGDWPLGTTRHRLDAGPDQIPWHRKTAGGWMHPAALVA